MRRADHPRTMEKAVESQEKVPVEIGIEEKDRQKIADGLSVLLADSYTLYVKTHNYHWNVTGPQFQALHKMFEEQYIELQTAVDDIAERIRAIGFFAPASLRAFQKLSSIEEDEPGEVPKADEMIRALVEGHQTLVRTVRSMFPVVHKANDESTLNMLTDRLNIHEKTAWMLRSLLD
jgi:starvation-inducible DNA-binding protein